MDVDGSEEDEGEVESFPSVLDEEERCAACQEVIPFDQLGKATCRNGHAWSKSSTMLKCDSFSRQLIPIAYLQFDAVSPSLSCPLRQLGHVQSAAGNLECLIALRLRMTQ